MRPVEWVAKILERHGLQKPDGRPLYQYRISDDEYSELRELIVTSAMFGFENTSRRLLMWDAVMVMYAAEWWRRHYSGKWGWEGIFDSVGFKLTDISTGARNHLIEVGLNRWNRNVRSLDGRRHFLGTVATEGGLPLRQLSDSGGWLKFLLSPVVKKHVNRGLDAHVLIDAYQDYIPTSYRSLEIKQILEDIVHTVAEIRQAHQLEDKSDPIKWLDDHVNSWRELFPLPIDDEAGKSLLSELIGVASKVSASNDESFDALFQMDRFVKTSMDDFSLIGRLDLPSSIPIHLLQHLENDSLPGRVEIELVSDDGKNWPWCKAIRTIIKGEDSYKLNGRSFEVDSEYVLKGFSVRAKALGEVIFEIPVMYGDRLELDSPWLFKITENRYEYFGATSQNVNDDEAIIYLPDEFEFELVKEDTKFDFVSSFLEGNLYSLKGQVSCRSGSEKYTFETGAEESLFSYELIGKQYGGFSNPSSVYIGVPDVFQRNKLTGIRKRLNSASVLVKPIGDNGEWKHIREANSGVQEIRIVENGIVKWRKRVGILDDGFQVTLKPDRSSPFRGSLKLESCQAKQVAINMPDCDANIGKDSDATVVNLFAKYAVPPSVLLSILLPNSHREIQLTAPFPSSGALLYDSYEKNIKTSAPLHLSNLYGYRLNVFDEQYHPGKTAVLRFSLVDQEIPLAKLRDIYIERVIKLAGPITEFALSDWQSTLEKILGVGSLDSYVQATLLVNGQDKFKISFFHYQYELQGLWEAGHAELDEASLKTLDSELLQNIKLKALRLNQPEQADVELEPILSQGVPIGAWNFDPQNKKVGSWLIYPADDSSIKTRPLLWIISDSLAEDPVSVEEIRSLPRAVVISDKEQREKAIRSVLNLMSEDPDHKSWDYLSNLLFKTKHLPLSTFDIWQCAVSELKFLASLFVRTGFEDVVGRLEEELPIIWELVRLSDWTNALNCYRASLVKSMADGSGFLDEASSEAINAILSRKIDAVNNLSSSMDCISKILRFDILNEEDKELGLMSLPAEIILAGQVENEFMSLWQRHSESVWPEMLNAQIKQIHSNLPKPLQPLIRARQDFQISVAYLPLLLAWRINNDDYYGWLGSAADIFKIVQLKEFDEDWFNAIFNLSSGWISRHPQELIENSDA